MQAVDKQLKHFSHFAGHFSQAVIPIVQTAIKMSSGEPVSAYGVFKAAKVLADANKKSKNQTKTGKKENKGKGPNKGGKRKMACAPGAEGDSPPKSLAVKQNKTKAAAGKKSNAKDSNKKEYGPTSFKDSEITSLVETLYTDDDRKLTKAEQKKKEELENYLVKQLEMDDITLGEEEDDSFDSEGGEEEESYTDTSTYSDEYTFDEPGSYSDEEGEEEEEGSSSTNEEDNQKADALAKAILSRANKKRKSPETTQISDKNQVANGNLEVKRTKKAGEDTNSKGAVRKSMPNAKTDKSNEPSKQRKLSTSLNSLEDKNKKPTTSNTSTVNVKLEPLSPPSNVIKMNSIEEGKRAFKWLINPVSVEDFFKKYWEQKACLIKRQQDTYFKHLISFEAIDQMLIKNHVEFTKNIDVTSYKNGKEKQIDCCMLYKSLILLCFFFKDNVKL